MPEFQNPQSICRFGIARRDITPEVGIYHRMWGAASHDRSEGVHRPLTATAMVLAADDDSKQRQFIVAVDHCLLFFREMEQLIQRICSSESSTSDNQIKREELIVTFSHTHAAGLMEESRADLPGGELIAPYLEELAKKIVSAIDEAIASLKQATIVYSKGHCNLAAQRDFWDAQSQQYVCGFNPEAPADDSVVVASVFDSSGKQLATIVNYACHPTTLAWDNRQISPDYVGAMREVIEQATGVPSLFLQGASGDLGPREGFVGDLEVADSNGRQLGYAALSALQGMLPPKTKMQYSGPVISGATIGKWERQPLNDQQLQQKSRWQIQRLDVSLPYRPELKSHSQAKAELEQWRSQEQTTRQSGDESKAADARAMVERKTRQLTRLAGLPAGSHFPFPVTLWRMGDVFWLAVEGEPYNLLQRALRERFAGVTIVVISLANGSRVSYLPAADAYGKGIYQEGNAVLEQGSLEQLIGAISQRIEQMLT